jgi:hypothetical protein
VSFASRDDDISDDEDEDEDDDSDEEEVNNDGDDRDEEEAVGVHNRRGPAHPTRIQPRVQQQVRSARHLVQSGNGDSKDQETFDTTRQSAGQRPSLYEGPRDPNSISLRNVDPLDPVYVPMQKRKTLLNTKDSAFRVNMGASGGVWGRMFGTFEAAASRSRFRKWEREELVDMLVYNDVELFSEHLIPTVTLRDQVEMLFEGYPMPEKVPPLTVREHYLLSKYAHLIQYKFLYERGLIRRSDSTATDPTDEYFYDEVAGTVILHMPSTDSEMLGSTEDDPVVADAGMINQLVMMSNSSDMDDALSMSISFDPDTPSGKESPSTVRSPQSPQSPMSPQAPVSTWSWKFWTWGQAPVVKLSRDEKRDRLRKKLSKRTLDVMDKHWRPADEGRAMETAKYLHPRKGGKGGERFGYFNTYTGRHCVVNGCGETCDLWEEGIVSEFSPYGPGITNYFKFLKWLYWVFLVLSVFALPELVINIYGSSDSSSGLNDLSQTTVGNLANTIVNTTDWVPLPGCNSVLFGEDNCHLNRNSLGRLYSWLDIGMSSVILIAFVWLWRYERAEEKSLDSLTLYTSMYSVAVRDLPPDVNEKQLKDHFTKLLRSDYGHSVSVQGVTIAVDSSDHIRMLTERGQWLHKKSTRVHHYRYQCDEVQKRLAGEFEKIDKACYHLLKQFEVDSKAIDERLAEIDIRLRKLEKKNDVPVVAYVTFDYIVGALLIKDMYQIRLIDRIMRFFLPVIRCFYRNATDAKDHLLINGKLVTVKSAPEPGSIIWENLQVPKLQRWRNRALTVIGAFLLIVVSIVVTFSAKLLQERAAESGGDSLCPTDFSSLAQEDQELAVESDSSILHCFCDQYTSIEQQRMSLCRHYVTQQAEAQALTFFSSFIVLAISSLIEIAIRNFADFEKHDSQDTRERSIFMRLFYLKYLNTSFIFFINNNQVLKYFFGADSYLTKASTNNFSSAWYASVGVSVILVQIGNIVTAQAHTIYDYVKFNIRLKAAQRSINFKTQRDLTKAFTGPEFELGVRYSSILSTFCVLLTFSSGMPLLNFVGFCAFGLQFMVDKFAFISLYRTPHRYTALMGKIGTMVVPFAVCLHLAMSIWMLSNPEIFDSTHEESHKTITSIASQSNDGTLATTISRNIRYPQTYPLFVMFLIIGGSLVLYGVVNVVHEGYHRFRVLIHGDYQQKLTIQKYVKEFHNKAAPQFSRAVRSNYISGLASYNILHNPIYKEKFGISWKFALTHDSLRDVRRSNFIADEDDDIIKAHNTILRKYKVALQQGTSFRRFSRRPSHRDVNASKRMPSPAKATFMDNTTSSSKKSDRVRSEMAAIAQHVEAADRDQSGAEFELRDSEYFEDDAGYTRDSMQDAGNRASQNLNRRSVELPDVSIRLDRQ